LEKIKPTGLVISIIVGVLGQISKRVLEEDCHWGAVQHWNKRRLPVGVSAMDVNSFWKIPQVLQE
jgi:hypothetical protein